MKKLLIVVCALSMLIVCVGCGPVYCVAYAADGDTDTADAADGEDKPVVETVETPAGQTVSVTMSPVVKSGEDKADTVTVYNAESQSDHEDGTLPALVKKVFGTYTPRTQKVTNYLADGSTVESTEVISGIAGVDWYWITGVVLFSQVLWSFFRFLGVVIKSHG